MKQKISNHKLFFWGVLAFALLIRLVCITTIPSGINQDEAMLAVDAWALSEYGTDRFGMHLPVHLTAWGVGQMSSLLAYLTIPFIKLLGFNTFSVRLPIALVSTLGVLLIYLISRKIFNERLSLGIMLLTTINPWHFMQSRWSLDCNLYPHVFLIAFYFLLCGLEKKRFLYLSMIFFGLTFYCYGVAIYTTPIFLLLYAIWCLKKRHFTSKDILISITIFLVVTLPEIITMAINIFSWETIKTPFFTMPYFPDSIRSNDILLINFSWKQLFINARSLFTQAFLQFPDWPQNSIPLYGPMYLISVPFILVGIYRFRIRIFDKHEESCSATDMALFIFLLMCIWSGLITSEVNISRINIIFYPLIIFCAYGINRYTICNDEQNSRSKKCVFALIIASFVIYALSFFTNYFTKFPQDVRRYYNADFVEITNDADDLTEFHTLYITINMDWNYGYQMSEILTQYSCQTTPAYFMGKTNIHNGKEMLPYAERYHYLSLEEMQDSIQLETTDTKTLYIVFRDELEDLPDNYEIILENEKYLAVDFIPIK